MIKILTLQFEELPSENHWITFAKFGSLIKYEQRYFDSYRDADEFIRSGEDLSLPLTLEDTDNYQIAMDQSTTNAGVFIKNYNNTRAWMIEVRRANKQDADDFIFDFEMFLHWFCKDGHITHLIYERPISNDNYRSSQVLFQLEGMIRSLVKRYREFKDAKLDFIENAAWRSVVVFDEYKQNRGYPQKEGSYRSIRETFDWTNIYGPSLGSDNDIYEAMGIMFGWFIKSYDALGRPYVRGDRYYGAIGGFCLPGYSAKDICEQLKAAGITSTWYMQNPDKSTYENIASAVERHKVVCIELTNSYSMLTLTIECNFKWTNPDKMAVILVAANYVDKRLFEITGKEFHFVF